MSDAKVAYVRFVVGDFGNQFNSKKIVYSDISANSWLTPVGIRSRKDSGLRPSKPPPKINSVIQKSIQDRAQSAAAILGYGRCNSERCSLEKEVLRGKSLYQRPMTADYFPACPRSRGASRTPFRMATQSDAPVVVKEWVALNIQPIVAPKGAKGESGDNRTAEQRKSSANHSLSLPPPSAPLPPTPDFRSFDEMKRGLELKVRYASQWEDEKPVTPKPVVQETNSAAEAPPKYFRAPLRPLLYSGEHGESVKSSKSSHNPFKACLASDDYFIRLGEEKQRAEEQIRRSRRIISANNSQQPEQHDQLIDLDS